MAVNNLCHNHPILFYDGYCYLCSSTIRLLIALGRKKKLRFISLQKGMQTPDIKKLISIYEIEKSIVFLSDEKIYIKYNN